MDDGCAIIAVIIGAIVAVAIAIALIVYVVLPLSLFILGSIATAGVVSGAVVAVKNFGEVLLEAHKVVPLIEVRKKVP
jgi:hypothetical protein